MSECQWVPSARLGDFEWATRPQPSRNTELGTFCRCCPIGLLVTYPTPSLVLHWSEVQICGFLGGLQEAWTGKGWHVWVVVMVWGCGCGCGVRRAVGGRVEK